MRFLAFLALVALCRGSPINPEPFRDVTTTDVETHCLSVQSTWDIDDFLSTDPVDCRGFYVCVFTAQEDGSNLLTHQAHFWCPEGEHFDEALRTCVDGSLCVQDACVNHIAYYLPDASENQPCNTFYQCDNHVSKLRCCPGDLVFDPITTTCIENETCQDAVCPSSLVATPDDVDLVEGECRLGDYIYKMVDAGQAFVMLHLDRTIPWGLTDLVKQACPEGTMFMGSGADVSMCYCAWVGEPPVVVADPMTQCKSFTYEPTEVPSTYVETLEALVTSYADGASHGLCFSGTASSYISLPYYNGNDWKNGFTAAVRYRFNDWESHVATSLLTNGDADTPATIDMELSDDGVKVTLVMDDATECMVELPILQVMPLIIPTPMPEYVDVTAMYDGQLLSVRHGDSTVSVACSGEIKIQHEPMVIGTNFAGCIDDLHICKSPVDPYAVVTPLT